MRSLLPILLLGLGGLLIGGAYSLFRQHASKVSIAVVGVLGLIAAVGGVLWLQGA